MPEEMDFLHRTWIDVDLDVLVQNYKTACSLTDALVTCVIKANAYGHGAVRVAQALSEVGCRSFAVSCAREALELRQAEIEGEILVMGLTEAYALADCLKADITLTAGSCEDLCAIEKAAEENGKTAHVHIKLDTGFHRLGVECSEANAKALAETIAACKHVCIEGAYTHLGLVNKEQDTLQHDRLLKMVGWLRGLGVTIPEVHICDSIGLVRYPDWHHERVRAGAFLFGVRPYRSEHLPFACPQTLTLNTTVARVHDVKQGEYVGYNDLAPAEKDMRVATLCAGYGDGYSRCLSNGKGKALIRGKLAPIIGLICMDQMMVDVSDIPDCAVGDTAALIGGGISYMDVADWANTNRNEVLTLLSRRPLRVYHQNGKIVTIIDSMLNERRDAE